MKRLLVLLTLCFAVPAIVLGGPFGEQTVQPENTAPMEIPPAFAGQPDQQLETASPTGSGQPERPPEEPLSGPLSKQIQDAVKRSRARGMTVTSGADKVNLADLNNWLVHFREDSGVSGFSTGREKQLIDKIKAISTRLGRGLTVGEILEISLKLNQGDVAQSLMTVHNSFRQLSRGRDGIEGLQQDTDFFHRYLDSASLGKKSPKAGEDISDEWYHFFGLATMAFVGDQKSPTAAARDFLNRSPGNDKRANLATMAGILKSGLNPLSWLPGNGIGTAVAVNDALGEQVYYGYLASVGEYAASRRNGNFLHDCWINLTSWGHGFGGIEGDEFMAELRGAAMGSQLAVLVKP